MRNRLFLSMVGCIFCFASYTGAYSKTALIEATDRIVTSIQKQPLYYTPSVVYTALDMLEKQLSHPSKKEIIMHLRTYLNGYFTCREHNGERVQKHLECEWIDEKICTEYMGGTYHTCVSACRHMPVTICTLACVPLCSI